MGRGEHIGEPRGLTVSVSAEGRDVIVRVAGELDLATAPRLQRKLEQTAPLTGGRVILDLRALNFSDLVGFRVIEQAGKMFGPRLIVCGSRPPVRRMFRVTRLDQVVQLEKDEAPVSDVPASNVAYVRYLWEGFNKGGAELVADMVPSDCEWKPLHADGRVLRGPRGVAEFWGSRGGSKPSPVSFVALGNDVVVGVRLEGGEKSEIWTLYRFDRRRLIGAFTFEHRADAVAAHDPGDAS